MDEGSEPVGVWRCKGDVQMSVWPSPGPLLHVKPFAAGAAALWRSHGPGRLLVKLQARSLLLDYPVPAERFFAPSLTLSRAPFPMRICTRRSLFSPPSTRELNHPAPTGTNVWLRLDPSAVFPTGLGALIVKWCDVAC